MTIHYQITIGSPLTVVEHARIAQIIADTFSHVDQIYNCWNPESELSHLNGLDANCSASISSELEALLQITEEVVKLSEGRFDPTVRSLQELWKQHLEADTTPNPEEITSLASSLGWNQIHFSHGCFWKEQKCITLDLGGIAKGYCVDLLAERLLAAGYPNLFVEWGGEIRTAGHHPEGRPWHLFISRFEDTNPTHAIAHLDLTNGALATSGDYFQHWNVKEKSFFHIFNPETKSPMVKGETTIASASVLAPTCTLADGLATTAMLFPSRAAAELWAKKIQEIYPTVQFWFISRE